MWKTRASKIVYETPWLKLREDKVIVPCGEELTFTFVDKAGAVFMVPITATGNIILIRSYRQTVKDWCWEVPAGSLADVGEMPVHDVAVKELKEEIGATSFSLKNLGSFYLANGMANARGTFFVAADVEYTGQPELDVGEEISDIREFTPSVVEEMVLSGEISDADSCFALLLASKHLEKNKVK